MSEKMTVLEVLKKIKHVDRKVEKNKKRLGRWCSYFNTEVGELGVKEEKLPKPQYDTKKLLQTLNDLLTYRAQLQHALHRANIENTTEYKGKTITIDELIGLRTEVLPARLECLKLLRRKEKTYQSLSHLTDEERKKVFVITQFDPAVRDRDVDAIEDEAANIDTLLDEINITLPTTVNR